MDEVHVQAVQRGGELRPAVEQGLALAPVITASPMRHQRLQPGQRHTLGPGLCRARHRLGLGPAGALQALLQVVEHRIGDGDLEGVDGIGHGVASGVIDGLRSGNCGRATPSCAPRAIVQQSVGQLLPPATPRQRRAHTSGWRGEKPFIAGKAARKSCASRCITLPCWACRARMSRPICQYSSTSSRLTAILARCWAPWLRPFKSASQSA